MAYTAEVTDCSFWWITGTGSAVNRLSEVMDDVPLGPYVTFLDADDSWAQNGATNEWYVLPAYEPDNMAESLAGWHTMTQVADNTEIGGAVGTGLAVDEWCWDSNNSEVYIRLSDDSDPNDIDVRMHYDWNGGDAGVDFMTEHLEDVFYQIHNHLEIGDGTTSTTLTSSLEFVYGDNGIELSVLENATLTLGELHESHGRFGSFWSFSNIATPVRYLVDGGTLNLYASTFHTRTNDYRRIQGGGSFTAVDSTLSCSYSITGGNSCFLFNALDYFELRNVLVTNTQGLYLYDSPDIMENVHVHDAYWGIVLNANNEVYAANITLTDCSQRQILVSTNGCLILLNPLQHVENIAITAATHWCKEAYTVDIHVSDKDGNSLSGVSVLIEDISGNIVSCVDSETDTNEPINYTETGINVDDGTKFTVGDVIKIGEEFLYVRNISTNTLTTTRGYYTNPTNGYPAGPHFNDFDIYITGAMTTDVNGDTPQIIVNYKQWYGTDETESVYSPHKFTISKAGYETLILENITVDHPIVWHLELQQQKQPVAAWQEGMM